MLTLNSRNSFIKETRHLWLLALPLIMAALAQMGMEIVDTLMMGRLGANALASGSLGSAIFIFLILICMGILTAVGVLVARAYGAENYQKVSKITRQGFWVATVLAVPTFILTWLAPYFLLRIGEKQQVIIGTTAFLHGLAWGILPIMGFFVLREFVTAVSKPRIVMIISVISIPFSAVANYILMYGKLGFPVLGIAGIGIASSLIEWMMFLSLAAYVIANKTFNDYKIFKFELPKFNRVLEIFRIGIPVGILYAFEIGLFSITALMMGYFGVTALAAHQIALQATSVAFMVPLGISQAAAVRVSQALGAHRYQRARTIAYAAMMSGVISAGIAGMIFWLLPRVIIALFLNIHLPENIAVVHFATTFLWIAALFTIMDALQVILNGILRGMKDTLIPMLLGLISYWGVGLGLGYSLAFHTEFAGNGLWWGLAVGITVSASLLFWRFQFFQRSRLTSKTH